jgi:hypothetical protein
MADGRATSRTYAEHNVARVAQAGVPAFENVEPFLFPTNADSWAHDEFSHDPDYLASQEVLRSLLFTTARSAAPTRSGTPENDEETNRTEFTKHVLAKGRNIVYLKNYISKVAPWVRSRSATQIRKLTCISLTCLTVNVPLGYSSPL